jgi:hypothetical protein
MLAIADMGRYNSPNGEYRNLRCIRNAGTAAGGTKYEEV